MTDFTPGAPGAYDIEEVAPETPGALMCGFCGKHWLTDITPSARCPWEDEHDEPTGIRVRRVEMTVTFEDGHTVQAAVSSDSSAAWGDVTEYLAETVAIREAVQSADIEWVDQ